MENRKIFIFGILLFSLVLAPHLYMLKQGALVRRLNQVTYLGKDSYKNYGVKYHNYPQGRVFYVTNEFLSQFSAYYSPRNLFFDPDPQGGRSIPDLSVYYPWMVIPFIAGIVIVFQKYYTKEKKLFFWMLVISAIPAALSNDPFYTLRVFLLLWCVGVIIALGLEGAYRKVNNTNLVTGFFILLFILSIMGFYRKYFVLFVEERATAFGYHDKIVSDYIKDRSDTIVIDYSGRDLATGLRMAYYLEYEPEKLQKDLGTEILDNYYLGYTVEDSYHFDNVEVRQIVWGKDVYKKQLLVGDLLAISDDQKVEHKLQLIKEISDPIREKTIRIYKTNPEEKCKGNLSGITIEECIQF